MNVLLWIIQILLAALFLFAGVLKLVLPLDKLTGPVAVPGLFLRFIGLCETLGGLGLILPGLLRIRSPPRGWSSSWWGRRCSTCVRAIS